MNQTFKPPVATDVDSDFRLDTIPEEATIETLPAKTKEKEQELPAVVEAADGDAVDADFDSARKNIQKILSKSDEALNGVLALARVSDHPRAYEVAATMMKTLAELNKDLLEIHEKKNKLKPAKTEQNAEVINNTQQNIVFNGTPSELQKLLRGDKE